MSKIVSFVTFPGESEEREVVDKQGRENTQTVAEDLESETAARQAADTALQTTLSEKQDKLTAGENIEISEDGTISAKGGSTAPVSSVNGKTGAVDLNAEDVGALPDSTVIPAAYDDTALSGRVTKVEGDIASLPQPSGTPTVGQIYQVSAISEDGKVTMTPVNMPTVPDVPVQDVQVNGTSVLSDGVANVPLGKPNVAGVVKTDGTGNNGVNVVNGVPYISMASTTHITNRKNGTAPMTYRPIVPSTLDFAVKAALTDNNRDQTYTDAEKANARDMIGAAPQSAVSDAWDSSVTYAAGDYCIYDGSLWKSLAENTDTEPSESSTYWEQTSIADEINPNWTLIEAFTFDGTRTSRFADLPYPCKSLMLMGKVNAHTASVVGRYRFGLQDGKAFYTTSIGSTLYTSTRYTGAKYVSGDPTIARAPTNGDGWNWLHERTGDTDNFVNNIKQYPITTYGFYTDDTNIPSGSVLYVYGIKA